MNNPIYFFTGPVICVVPSEEPDTQGPEQENMIVTPAEDPTVRSNTHNVVGQDQQRASIRNCEFY